MTERFESGAPIYAQAEHIPMRLNRAIDRLSESYAGFPELSGYLTNLSQSGLIMGQLPRVLCCNFQSSLDRA